MMKKKIPCILMHKVVIHSKTVTIVMMSAAQEQKKSEMILVKVCLFASFVSLTFDDECFCLLTTLDLALRVVAAV